MGASIVASDSAAVFGGGWGGGWGGQRPYSGGDEEEEEEEMEERVNVSVYVTEYWMVCMSACERVRVIGYYIWEGVLPGCMGGCTKRVCYLW